MEINLGWILGPVNLILAGAALYLLYKNRINVNPKLRLVLDFTTISIICAVFWGIIGGTSRAMGFIDVQTASFISLILSTLYLIFTFLAVWYWVHNLAVPKYKKKKK